jgi:acyl carrier protein|tara:strand:- start:44 stop:328 length:285 start_codon:yes stop_codon:yes gene_type:complete
MREDEPKHEKSIMDRNELLNTLSRFLNEAMMGAAKDIQPDDDLAQRGLDSMGTVEFVTLVEEEFGLDEITPEEISRISTLNAAADLVLTRRAGQ